jgi:hypothetical protein
MANGPVLFKPPYALRFVSNKGTEVHTCEGMALPEKGMLFVIGTNEYKVEDLRISLESGDIYVTVTEKSLPYVPPRPR